MIQWYYQPPYTGYPGKWKYFTASRHSSIYSKVSLLEASPNFNRILLNWSFSVSDNKAGANHNNQFRCLPDSRTTLFQQKNNIDGSHHSASRQSTSIPFNHCRLVLQLFRRSTLNYLFNLIFFTLINLVWPIKLNFILRTAFKLVLIIYLFSVLHLCAKVVVISCRGCVTGRKYGYPVEIDAKIVSTHSRWDFEQYLPPAKTGLEQPGNAQVDGLAAEGSAPPPCVGG